MRQVSFAQGKSAATGEEPRIERMLPRSRGPIIIAAVGAALVWMGAVVITESFDRTSLVSVASEARRASLNALTRAQDALAMALEALELTSHNAASNPRLIAAVKGRVDGRTFADLFLTERWWEPYRGNTLAGISLAGEGLTWAQTDELQAVELRPLLKMVRERNARQSQVLLGPRRVLLLAAGGVSVGTSDAAPVLVLGRPLDGTTLDVIATRSGGPILLSDGKQALGRSGTGPAAQWLIDAIGTETTRERSGSDPRWAAAAATIGSNLWMWVGADVTGFALREQASLRVRKALTWAGALGLSLLAVAFAWRQRKGPRVAASALGDPVPMGPLPLIPSGAVAPGTKLGRYVLLDLIGAGGMAEVYTAAAFGGGGFRRSFVIKRLRPQMTGTLEAVTQFIDEANLGSTLIHPNIISVYDFGQVGADYFIAQEYVVGRDLGRLTRRMIERSVSPLSPAAILYLAHEVLSGLEYAHEKRDDDGTPLGLVHRDVSPENIMISARGEVKLLDFGLVKTAQGRLTQTDIGLVKGNVDFMAPEQARGRAVDPRTDLFSLGLVLYFAATGQPLYTGETLFDRLTKAAAGLSAADLAAIAELPAPLPSVIAGALKAEPGRVFSSAAEFQAATLPYLGTGRDELVVVMRELFADDLQCEQDRLTAAFPRRPTLESSTGAV